MNEAKTQNFLFADGVSHDASVSETSSSLRYCYKNVWSLFPVAAGLTSGDSLYTIEVSNDDVNWFEYNNLSTDVSIVDSVDDNHLAWVYIRVVYKAQTETTGTVEFSITSKQQ